MKKVKGKKIKVFAIFLLIIICYVYFSATNLILQLGESDFKSMISNCSYYALGDIIKEDFKFDEICTFTKNQNGDVILVNTNMLLVNYLNKKLSLNCSNYIKNYVSKGVTVPIGVFTGIRLFSGFGKRVNLKLVTTISVDCDVKRQFISCGVNQTRQILSVMLHTKIDVITFFKTKSVCEDIEIAVFDNLIVGKVPDTYLSADLLNGFAKK